MEQTVEDLQKEIASLKKELDNEHRARLLAEQQALRASIVASQLQLIPIDAEIASWQQQPAPTTSPST
jgi:hypothetical protein